jgi:hypothetical protein
MDRIRGVTCAAPLALVLLCVARVAHGQTLPDPEPLDQPAREAPGGAGGERPDEYDKYDPLLQLERPESPEEPKPKGPDRPLPRFGEAGEFVVTTGAHLGVSSTSWDGSDAKRFAVGVQPSLDYFFVRNLSLGIGIDVATSDSQGYGADSSLVRTKSLLLGGGARVGYNIPFGSRVSLYPHLTFGVHRVESTQEVIEGQALLGNPTGTASTMRTGPWMSLDLPVLFHVAPHFFIGFGPSLYHDFSRTESRSGIGAERTVLRAGLLVGGFWGDPSPPPPRTSEPETEKWKPRFGDRNQVVLTEESTIAVGMTWYSDIDSSATGLTLAPGIDWFLGERFSVGGAVGYSRGQSLGFDPSGRRVTYDSSSLGGSLRFGFVVPLSERLSLYPRISFGFGNSKQEIVSGLDTNSTDAKFAFGSASLPFLVHVTDHFFIGFGPTASHDFSRSYGPSNRQNRATTIGATTVIGGWL